MVKARPDELPPPTIQAQMSLHLIMEHADSTFEHCSFTLHEINAQSYVTKPPATEVGARMDGKDLKFSEQCISELLSIVCMQNGGATKVDEDCDESLLNGLCRRRVDHPQPDVPGEVILHDEDSCLLWLGRRSSATALPPLDRNTVGLNALHYG